MSAKRRAIGLPAVALTLGGLALAAGAPAVIDPSQALAASAVTIHGPQYAGYGVTVHLTGTAPAHSTVSIYFHRKNASGYTKRRTLTADAAGHYATTYISDTDYRYYAAATGHQTQAGLTRLPTVTCTTSTAIPGAMPFPKDQVDHTYAVAAAQASNGAGRVAGIAFDGSFDYAVIAKTPGHPFGVLGRFTYQSTILGADVHVDAVTRAGGVLVDAQPTNTEADRRVAFVFTGGRRYQLARASNWESVVPIGVTAAGTVVGVARTGSYSSQYARYYVVTWAGASAPYKVLVRNGAQDPFAAVAANGAIAYTPNGGESYNVRYQSGRIAHLATAPGAELDGLSVDTGAGNAFYGQTNNTVARWSVSSYPASGTVPATLLSPSSNGLDWFLAAGQRGDVVAYRGLQRTTSAPRYLRTAGGALVQLPTRLRLPHDEVPDLAVDGDSSVAYTAPDRLPHVLHCH